MVISCDSLRVDCDRLRVARNNNIPDVDSRIEITPGGSGAIPSIEVLGGLNIVNTGELGDGNINIINNSNWPLTLSSLSAIEMRCQQLTISNIFSGASPSIDVALRPDRTITFNLETSKGVAHTISLNGDDHIMNFDMEVKASNLITGGFIKKGSYNYSLPNKSGTIALTSDIPSLDIDSSLYIKIQELTIEGYNNITSFNIEDSKYIKIIPFESNIDSQRPGTLNVGYRSDFSDYVTISDISSRNYLFPIEITRNDVDSQNYNIHIKYTTISNNVYTIRSKVYHSSNDIFNNLYFDLDTSNSSEYLKVFILTIDK